VEVFLDETSRGLRGTLSLVVDGPDLGDVGPVPAILQRLTVAAGETLPEGYPTPLTLRLVLPDSGDGALPRLSSSSGSSFDSLLPLWKRGSRRWRP
jgi:hypothetical protein